MAYVAPSTINVGDPVTATDYNILVNDVIDHESRIAAVEAFAQRVVFFDDVVWNATAASTLTGIAFVRVPVNCLLTEAKVAIYEKGVLTGTLEIDVHKQASLDMTGSVSVFTTRPSLAMASASNYDESTNAVFGAAATLTAGQYLRLDITSLPTNGVMGRFYVTISGEV